MTEAHADDLRHLARALRLLHGQTEKVETLLIDANDLLRSLFLVCDREGADTNWTILRARVKEALHAQHHWLYPRCADGRHLFEPNKDGHPFCAACGKYAYGEELSAGALSSQQRHGGKS